MPPKQKIIDIEAHALLRTLERGLGYNLNYYETKERVYCTVKSGRIAKRKHKSDTGKTYYYYFGDGLAFYVIAQEKEFADYVKVLIKTIIIEEGRE